MYMYVCIMYMYTPIHEPLSVGVAECVSILLIAALNDTSMCGYKLHCMLTRYTCILVCACKCIYVRLYSVS